MFNIIEDLVVQTMTMLTGRSRKEGVNVCVCARLCPCA